MTGGRVHISSTQRGLIAVELQAPGLYLLCSLAPSINTLKRPYWGVVEADAASDWTDIEDEDGMCVGVGWLYDAVVVVVA